MAVNAFNVMLGFVLFHFLFFVAIFALICTTNCRLGLVVFTCGTAITFTKCGGATTHIKSAGENGAKCVGLSTCSITITIARSMLKLSGGTIELNEQFFKGKRERERKKERRKSRAAEQNT